MNSGMNAPSQTATMHHDQRSMRTIRHGVFTMPIYISAEGGNVITGARLSARLSHDHPLRRAYEIWLGKENQGRAAGI